ncbi:MAG: RimK family alpha-L-glutamate ligase [Anaerolineales bacterium]|nr:RimK family alpha-L-glutamate ligase [Anaerolineales bacterium]
MDTIKFGILSDPQSWHSQKLQMAFAARHIAPLFFKTTRLQAHLGSQCQVSSVDTKLNELDLLLVRDVPGGSLEQIIYRMDALHQVEDQGVRVVNQPGAIEKMVDKYYTSSLLAGAGLPVPETIVTEQVEEAIRAFDWLGRDIVVKPLFGSQGVGMVRLTDREVAWRTFRALELGHYVFYLQQFIPHNNRDIRVFMIGNDCAAAMIRQADDWKTNLSQGARPFPFEASAEIVEMCRKAAQVVGADYCGVDLLPGEDGNIYLSEINSMLSWKGLQSVCTVDLADRLVAFLLELIES